MTIRILSRASELAIVQAELVGRALTDRWPDVKVVYQTRSSAGDRNPTQALAEAGNRGWFTEDLSRQLLEGTADLAVHSWKDLPVRDHPGTVVAATLPRADVRDVLFLRNDALAARPGTLGVLTSSPRRAWQLQSALGALLPWSVDAIEPLAVRGNVPTRLLKLLRGDGHGLVVAKAALDRLLSTGSAELATDVRHALQNCRWMILPVRDFPTAPAQGALAIEVAIDRQDVLDRVTAVSDQPTEAACRMERAILEAHGGGCHQAIGATVLVRAFGSVTSVKGLLPDGRAISRWSLDHPRPTLPPAADLRFVWPRPGETAVRTRHPRAIVTIDERAHLFVTRADALPPDVNPGPDQLVWAAGPTTWQKLARRGIWVNGSAEGLGDAPPDVDLLAGSSVDWVRMTHGGSTDAEALATYDVTYEFPADLAERTHFFWTSSSAFVAALAAHPEIRNGWHGSGPGRTATAIQRALGSTERASIWLDFDSWLTTILQ